MQEKKLQSRKNFKKSLYFGGSMAVVSAAVGLAVSIPVYKSIQEKLHQNLTKLANLSSYMTQLVDKLGISPDSEFSRELENGYKIVLQNGVTKIFQSINGEESMVMNMNLDGSVGTAAQFDGLAAQKMLNVITDAASTLGEESDAMDDILGPFIAQTEETSLRIEAAVTGVTEEDIRIRNALSVNNEAEKQANIAKLEAELGATIPTAKIDAISDDVKEARAQRAKEAADAAALAKAIADKKAQLQAARNDIKNSYIAYLISQTSETHTTLDPLTLEEVKAKYDAQRAKEAIEASKAAQEKASEAVVQRAASGGSSASSIIERIIASPSTFINTIIKTFGFDDGNPANHKAESPNLRRMIYNSFKAKGLSDETWNRWMVSIGGMVGKDQAWINAQNWFSSSSTLPHNKVVVTSIVNTYGAAQVDISKLITLEVSIENTATGNHHDGYIIGRATVNHVIDLLHLNSIFDFSVGGRTFSKEKIEAIKYLTKVINADVYTQVKNHSIKILLNLAQGTDNLKPITDPNFVEKLQKITDIGKTIEDKFLKNYLADLSVYIGTQTLFNSKTFTFDPGDFANAMKLVVEHDVNLNPGIKDSDLDSVYASPDSMYGQWMKQYRSMIFNQANGNIGTFTHALSEFYKKHKDASNTNAVIPKVFKSGAINPDFLIASQNPAHVINLYAETDVNIKSLVDKMDRSFWLKITNKIGKTGKVSSYSDLVNHIKQFVGAGNAVNLDHFVANFPDFIEKSLTNSMSDITNYVKAAIKLPTYDSTFNLQTQGSTLLTSPKAVELILSTDAWIVDFLNQNNIDFNFLVNNIEKVADTTGKATLAQVKEHIKQIYNITDDDGHGDRNNAHILIEKKPRFTANTLVSPKADISYEVKDAIKLISLNPDFDMNNKENIEKVQAASGVTRALGEKTGVSATDAKAITDKVRAALVITDANALTAAEFEQVVKYTDTVFSVFTNTSDAIAQLNKVLDPQHLKANIDKIRKFNTWITEIKKTATGTITKKMIEDYVWTYKGLRAFTSPVLPWATSVHPPLTSIIPTSKDGLTSVIHNGGGLIKLLEKEGEAPTYTDIFPSVTDTPLSTSGYQWSSTGGYDASRNIIISGNLKMTANSGKLIIWDLTTKTTKEITVSNANGVSASYIRNIIISRSGKVIMIDESGAMYQITQDIDTLRSSTFTGSATMTAFGSWATQIDKVFAVDTYIKDGVTYAVISNHKAGDATTHQITVINLDTNTLVSQTDIGDYFYALSVDKENGYAYAVGENNKQLWRIDIMHPANTEMLLAIDDLKDQDGNANPVPEAGTDFRGIFYDNKKHEIVAITQAHVAYIADNTKELKDIFDYLMKH